MKFKPEPELVLRPLQRKQQMQIIQEPATLIAAPLGSGKTAVAVTAVREHAQLRARDLRGHTRVMVVAPRNTMYGWERTVRRQYQNYTSPYLFRRIDSTKSGKEAMAALWAGDSGWFAVTWEYFALRPEGFWDKLDVEVVILDEVQRMQNRKSKTWANVKNLGKNAKRIAMSGTPNGNKMEGFWTTLRWLFPEIKQAQGHSLYRTPLSFWRWVADWLVVVEHEFLGFIEVKGERFEPGTMLSYYDSYIREADLPPSLGVNEIIVDVPLSTKQRALYKQIEKEAVTWLNTPDPDSGRKPLVIELPMTVRMRLRQVTLGEPIINDDNKLSYLPSMASTKINAVLDILKNTLEPMEPVLIFTHSREFAVAAAERFKDEGFPAWAWVGGTSDKQREAALVLWGMEDGIQVIIAVVEAIAEGIDGLQQICHNEIWLSESENMLMNVQAKKRLDRLGQTHVVNRWVVIAPETYDEGILASHIQRQLDLNQSLRDAKGTNA